MEAVDFIVSNPAKDRSMRASRSLFVLCGLALASPEACFAQVGQIGSYSRPRTNNYPTVSPYLNLARPGQAATNYYGIVRPQVEANQAFQQIQQGTFTTDPRFGPAMGPQGAGPDGGVTPRTSSASRLRSSREPLVPVGRLWSEVKRSRYPSRS